MNTKRAIVLLMGFSFSVALGACEFEEDTIIYKGEEMTVSEVEEKIADELEVENSDLDLEVSISEEMDD